MPNIIDLDASLFANRYFGLSAEALWNKLRTFQASLGAAPKNLKPRSRELGIMFRHATYWTFGGMVLLSVFSFTQTLSGMLDGFSRRRLRASPELDEVFVAIIASLARLAWDVAPLGVLAGALSRFSRSFLRPDAKSSLSADERRPIVLLRPFTDDRMPVKRSGSWVDGIANGFNVPFETVIAGAMGHFGPVIAIGEPGEWIPGRGAQRAYTSEGEWKDVVLKLIKDSLLTVVVPGQTEGVRWELDAVLQADALTKTIVVMPPHYSNARDAVLNEFLQKAGWASHLRSGYSSRVIAIHSGPDAVPVFYGAVRPTEDVYITGLLASVYAMFVAKPDCDGLPVTEDVEFRELVQRRELTLAMVQRLAATAGREE
jgi:hypothetical protein